MLSEISAEINIGDYNAVEKYNPENLGENVALFDECLEKYEQMLNGAGVTVKRLADVDAFVSDYCSCGGK